jgi:hypothetical protein
MMIFFDIAQEYKNIKLNTYKFEFFKKLDFMTDFCGQERNTKRHAEIQS